MRHSFIFLISLFIALNTHAQTKIASEDSSKIELTRLAINSNRGDFSPFLSGNKLYFTSGRVHRYGLVYIDADTTKELEDVFYAVKNDSLHFKHVHYFSEKINTKYNDGPLCFNATGDVLFITGNDEKRMIKDVEPLDIFMAKKVHGHWEHPSSLPFCTGTSTYCHPALMKDGKTLIFSSDIPGGFGGMDLYMSKFDNGTWSAPQNLGTPINTKDNEIFPFMSATNILYFSSSRKDGHGGLDFYKLDFNDPFNNGLILLPPPFNSPKDDFGIWVDSTGDFGYLSSNRGAGGDDDIYLFKNKYSGFENCPGQKKPTFCYTFFEESTLQAEDTLGMTYEWDLGDGTKMRGLRAKHCFKTPGNYAIQLNIIDKSSGALFYKELTYDFTVEEPKLLFIDCPDTIYTGKSIHIDSKKSKIPGYTLKENYWFFGDGKYALGSSAQHVYKKDGNYLLQLGVDARNDSTGKYKKLCVQKTILVKDSIWLKQHAKSITKPTWPPPKKGTTKYHKTKKDSVNYRVHLGSTKENIPTDSKIFSGLGDVKKQKQKDTYTYTSGNVKKLSDAIPYYLTAKEKGFKEAAVIGFYGDSLIINQEKSMKGEIPFTGIISVAGNTKQTFRTYTVWFDFDNSIILPSYKDPLDSLCDTLKKNKKLGLMIISISDSVGTIAYNLGLSKRRAASVQNYLVKKGIVKNRLQIIPLGENVPAKYKQQKNIVISNRRVELLLVKKQK